MKIFVRAVGIIGRVLVVIGVVLLYYTAYLLWGTSVQTRQAQAELAAQLRTDHTPAAARTLAAGEVPIAKPPGEPNLGDPLFQIHIPKIGVQQVVVHGVEAEELKKGPGHFPDSPWPGEKGNVPISGHRTTFNAPFYRLDELANGDEIFIEWSGIRYRYVMDEQAIVRPSQTEVVQDRGRDELTLTTCHPRYSAAQRLIVHAAFVGAEKIPPAGGGGDAGSIDASTSSNLAPKPTAFPIDVLILAGLALALLLSSLGMNPRFRRLSYGSGVSAVLAVLMWIFAFPEILKLLPAEF